MPVSTKEKLAQVLHARGLFDMESKARDGYYDDFQSSVATPILQLVNDLRVKAGACKDLQIRGAIEGLAKRAIAGEFDATKEEADAWAKSPDGRAAFNDLVSRR